MGKLRLIILSFVFLITFLFLSGLVASLTGGAFIAAFSVSLFLIITAFLGGMGSLRRAQWGSVLLALSFGVVVLLSLVFYQRYVYSLLLLVFAAVGFLIAIEGMAASARPVPRVREPAPVKKAEIVAKPIPIKASFSPGKFVGSVTGTTYHSPKCYWAKRVRKENQAWFASEAEAKKKGYDAHWCLKK